MSKIIAVKRGEICPAVLGAYAPVVSALCTDDFEACLWDRLTALVPTKRLYAYARPIDGGRAGLLVGRYEPWLDSHVSTFAGQHLDNDPVQSVFEEVRTSDACAVLQVGPRDIQDSFHREWFFERTRIIERLSIVMRSQTHWLGMNICRSRDMGYLSETEMAHFVALGPLLLPLILRHSQSTQRVSIEELEAKLQRRTTLTGRERQVCARAIFGMTSEATAIDLDIATASVTTYRKRAYARLNISSANELLRLVLN
jgi:DNA-binding CsgD family transcriptional regulator